MKKYLLIGLISFSFIGYAWSGVDEYKGGCISKACNPRKPAHMNGFCIQCLNNLQQLFSNKSNSDVGNPSKKDRVDVEVDLHDNGEQEKLDPENDWFKLDREAIIKCMKSFPLNNVKGINVLVENGFQQVIFSIKKLKGDIARFYPKYTCVEKIIAYFAINDSDRLIKYHNSIEGLVTGVTEDIPELPELINNLEISHDEFTQLWFGNITDFYNTIKVQRGTWVLINGPEPKNLVFICRKEHFFIVTHPLIGFCKIPVLEESKKVVTMLFCGLFVRNGGWSNMRYFKVNPQTPDYELPDLAEVGSDLDEEVAGLTVDMDNNVINRRLSTTPLQDATYDALPDFDSLNVHKHKSPTNYEME